MSEAQAEPSREFREKWTVPSEAIDENGHVNNVAYVRWMQDLAVRHWRQLGGMEIQEAFGATWVARSHWIEYLRPGYEGDVLERITWVANIGRVRSTRKYSFVRLEDGREIARGETDWVFVDAKTGRPVGIPRAVHEILPVRGD